jgi:hypothetical protein
VDAGPVHCRLCGDELPGAPPGVVTSRAWADWRARQRGDLLTGAEARDLLLFRGLCSLSQAIGQGNDTLPEW